MRKNRRERESARRRVLAGILGASLLVTGGSLTNVPVTEARFTDTEYIASDTFTSLRLAPPQITAVVNCSGLIGLGLANGVTLEWRFPTGTAYAGFTPATNAQWAFNAAGDNWRPVATTSPSAGVYRTTFNTGVISDLLTLLFGGSMVFQVRTKVGDKWVSAQSSKVTMTNALTAPSCSVPSNGT